MAQKKRSEDDGGSLWRPKDSPFLTVISPRSWWFRWLVRIPGVSRILRPGPPPVWFLAVLMPSLAAVATVFSILCRADIMNVTLCPVDTGCPAKNPTMVHVGYLYEANAAAFYLLVSWVWIWIYLRFLRTAKTVIAELAREHLLTTTGPGGNVLACIANLRRGICSRGLLLVVIMATSYSVVGSEFNLLHDSNPPHECLGDYWHLAFGYVQASAMPGYVGKTLDQLKAEGRSVEKIYRRSAK